MENNKCSIYQEHGYRNRREYLKSLSEDYGVNFEAVIALASILGKEEDFDGLITELEDYAEEIGDVYYYYDDYDEEEE